MTTNSELKAFKQGYIDLIMGNYAELGIGVTAATIIVDLAYNVVQQMQDHLMATSASGMFPATQREVWLSITLKMLSSIVKEAEEIFYADVADQMAGAFSASVITKGDLNAAFGEDPVEVGLRNAGVIVDHHIHGVVLHKALDVNCECASCQRMKRVAKTEGVRIVPDITVGGRLYDAYIMPLQMAVNLRLESEGITVQ